VWLFGSDATLIGGMQPTNNIQSMVGIALKKGEAENKSDHKSVFTAHRLTSDSARQYVIVWEAPVRLGGGLFKTRFLLRLLSLIVTGGIVCVWLTWYITLPIRTLREATRRFSHGDLATRVSDARELRRGDELSDLASDFDDMAARIEELVKAQQQLLADISHELRSPLARLSLALDLARRRLGEGIPEHQRIEREIQRLNDLIRRLLTLAQLQSDPSRSQVETVDLRSLVREIANDASFESEAENKKVVVKGDCGASVRGNASLLRSAIENVVRNAVRYSPEGTEVGIDMHDMSENRVVITVRDQGPGVPAASLHRLFDPFFRVDPARDRDSGGVGLGLAIVRQASLFHGGNVTAQNRPEGGLMVRLEFPVQPSSQLNNG
jgi:two-component system sensor histidine kinase CpxA